MKSLLSTVPVALLVVFSLLFVGCEQHQQTPYRTMVQQESGSVLQILELGSNEYHYDKKQSEVLPKLLNIVNSGNHNIHEVTTYYTLGYLTSAVITYDSLTTGDGNKVRLQVFVSDKDHSREKNKEVRANHTQFIKTPGSHSSLLLRNLISRNNRTVAIELYYYK